jgi:hypothetical protein
MKELPISERVKTLLMPLRQGVRVVEGQIHGHRSLDIGLKRGLKTWRSYFIPGWLKLYAC